MLGGTEANITAALGQVKPRDALNLDLSFCLLPVAVRSADQEGGKFSGSSHPLFDRGWLHPFAFEMLLKSFEPLFKKFLKGRFRKW